MTTCERLYLEPMVNGNNRVFLPNEEELKICSSALYSPKAVDLFRCQCTLTVKARYNSLSMSVKVEGIKDVYINRKQTRTSDTIVVSVGSIIEIHPEALIYILELSDVPKESINLNVDSSNDMMILKSRVYRWEMFTGGQLFTCTSSGFDDKRKKVAAFDLDGTLIKSKSGGCPQNHEDWTIWDDSVKSALANLHESGYKVIIFTNQARILKNVSSLNLHFFKMKLENIINFIGTPIQVYIATFISSIYRKPVPGMWKLMEFNCGTEADLLDSFFVGNAAGRNRDNAASDRTFAANVGVKFHTPEEFFLDEPPEPHTGMKYPPGRCSLAVNLPDLGVPSAEQEVIVMVGPPSCGKTFFVETYLIPEGYVPVSIDFFNDWNHSVQILSAILQENKSAVVDHRNSLVSDRWKFIHLCRLRDVKVRCFVMDWSVNRCLHNNKFKKMFDPHCNSVSATVLELWRIETPRLEEGYTSILSIPFIPSFVCDEMKFLYNCYLHAQ